MNVFDFDNSILRGDTTALFTKFCFRHYPAVRRHILRALCRALLMKMGRITLTEWKEGLFGFFALIPDMDAAVENFWAEHVSRVQPWYLAVRQEDDAVISASPEFLVAYACRRLGIKHVAASPVDPHTGKFSGPNCNKAEKVRRYRELFGDKPISRFYSDSHSDDPLAALAQEAFLIKKGRVRPWK